jgi:hypothetical protein
MGSTRLWPLKEYRHHNEGIPELSDIAGFSGITNRQDTKDVMELAIMITPHVVRLAHQETVGPKLLLSEH